MKRVVIGVVCGLLAAGCIRPAVSAGPLSEPSAKDVACREAARLADGFVGTLNNAWAQRPPGGEASFLDFYANDWQPNEWSVFQAKYWDCVRL